MLHDFLDVREILESLVTYLKLNFQTGKLIGTLTLLIIVIFSLCSLIDYIRIKVFTLIIKNLKINHVTDKVNKYLST